MHRLSPPAAFVLLFLAGCKIQETPPEYFSDRAAAAVEQEEARGELVARVGAFREALGRGDRTGALLALDPLPGAVVIGPGHADPALSGGPDALSRVVEEALDEGGGIDSPDLHVAVSLREGVGWFSTHLVYPADSGRPPLRASGVFARERGVWRLSQAHLSAAAPAPADTAAATARVPAPASPPPPAP